jgi:hypothetical protein
MGKNNTTFGEQRRPPGRPKGSPNKTTAAVKEAILKAFDSVGGPEYLVTVAQEDPRTFCALLGRVLPMEVTGEGGQPLKIVVVTGVPDPEAPAGE